MAFAIVLRVSLMAVGAPPALKLFSSARFFSSAWAHDRVFAENAGTAYRQMSSADANDSRIFSTFHHRDSGNQPRAGRRLQPKEPRAFLCFQLKR